MGYTTDFTGQFKLNRQLDPTTLKFLKNFAGSRRMARRLGPEYGIEGEFYVDGANDGNCGQDDTRGIIDYNRPPSTQPGLWCQWIPTEDGKAIEWDGGEKFYDYVEWLKYIIKNFLAPKDYVLNGQVEWQGEDADDRGLIVVTNNVVRTHRGHTVYGAPEEN